MDHHAIANHAVDPLAEDPRGHQRELVSHPLVNHRMTGVCPALVANDDVVLIAKQINNFPLGLISPLETHNAGRTHGTLLRSEGRPDRSLGIVKLQGNAGGLRRQSR